MTALIDFIARSLADDPDNVRVEMTEGDDVDTYELTMSQGDLGRVIGRQGRTARAMRAVLRAATAKQGRRAHLEILD